jgi:hypothetical protein
MELTKMTKPILQINNQVREMNDDEYKQWQFLQNDPLLYKSQRAAEYPSITEYLDGLVKGDQLQIKSYIDACLAVKAKYPKPV